jgi:hypothetical protein
VHEKQLCGLDGLLLQKPKKQMDAVFWKLKI